MTFENQSEGKDQYGAGNRAKSKLRHSGKSMSMRVGLKNSLLAPGSVQKDGQLNKVNRTRPLGRIKRIHEENQGQSRLRSHSTVDTPLPRMTEEGFGARPLRQLKRSLESFRKMLPDALDEDEKGLVAMVQDMQKPKHRRVSVSRGSLLANKRVKERAPAPSRVGTELKRKKRLDLNKYTTHMMGSYTFYTLYVLLARGNMPLYEIYTDSIFASGKSKLLPIHSLSAFAMWGMYFILKHIQRYKLCHKALGYLYYLNFALVFIPSGMRLLLMSKHESTIGTWAAKSMLLEQWAMSLSYTILSFVYILRGNVAAHKVFNDVNCIVTCFVVIQRAVGFVVIKATGSQTLGRACADLIPYYFFGIRHDIHLRFIFSRRTLQTMGLQNNYTMQQIAKYSWLRWFAYATLIYAFPLPLA